MRVKQEKENRLFEAKDRSDPIEYTSDTDDDTGCGSAVFDGSDEPREYDEGELLSPPNLPNGVGGTSCLHGTWSSYDECLPYNGWDEEHCSCVCLVNGPCGDYGVLPSFSIDDDEFQQCLVETSSEITAAIAACMITVVPAGIIATAAVSGGFTVGNPEPISSAVSGAVSLVTIGYIGLLLAECGVRGKALQMTYCGIKALRWD